MLTLKYTRLDFFNHWAYTEDKKENYTKEDLKRVFAYFSKNYNATFQIDDTVIFWDCMVDFDNRVATTRNYDAVNYRSYTDEKKSFDKMKKECYAMVQ